MLFKEALVWLQTVPCIYKACTFFSAINLPNVTHLSCVAPPIRLLENPETPTGYIGYWTTWLKSPDKVLKWGTMANISLAASLSHRCWSHAIVLLADELKQRYPGGCLNIKMLSYQYLDPRVKDKKMVSRPSYLKHGNPPTWERRSLYWDGAQITDKFQSLGHRHLHMYLMFKAKEI